MTEPVSSAPREGSSRQWRIAVLVSVALILVTVLVLKSQQSQGAMGEAAGVTVQRGDAVVAFEKARESGLPIYVLFHSLTCQPCIDISANVEQVIYDYEGEVAFVNAITDDAPSQQLAARFSFQYIPTSFFISPDGDLVYSHTGVLSPADLRVHLDELTAQ